MKKTALALITCTAAVALLAGCGSTVAADGGDTGRDVRTDADGGTGGDVGTDTDGDNGAVSQVTDSQADPEALKDFPANDGEEILIERPDPTITVTAEEFQDMMGYSFIVPDGAKDIYYYIDTESKVGKMQFDLDGVFWTAQMLQRDVYIRLDRPHVDDCGIEITCDFKDDPAALQVHGVDPEGVNGYHMKYSEDWEQYIYSANWFLEDEGYSISLGCYSDTRIDSMPVEVFP